MKTEGSGIALSSTHFWFLAPAAHHTRWQAATVF